MSFEMAANQRGAALASDAVHAGREIDLHRAVYALSDALDLVGVDDVLHGKRVAFLALEASRQLGLDAGARDDLRDAALIHDCGVSSTRARQRLIEVAVSEEDTVHCETGARLVSDVAPIAHLGPIILHHHAHHGSLAAVAARDAQLANVIFLADRVDVVRARHRDIDAAGLSKLLRQQLFDRHGNVFAPEVLAAFSPVLEDPAVWRTMSSPDLADVLARETRSTTTRVSLEALRPLAHLFAYVVDAKSHYTASHSQGVAALAVELARSLGLPQEELVSIEIAALLHDLGKLRIPDEIIDKPGPLSAEEALVLRQHSRYTFEILAQIEGFEQISSWAAMHHEMLDGSGYPEGLRAAELPIEARIITVADVFQALAQDRPYRNALAPKAILAVLWDRVLGGQLDGDVVGVIAAALDKAWQAARVGEMPRQ